MRGEGRLTIAILPNPIGGSTRSFGPIRITRRSQQNGFVDCISVATHFRCVFFCFFDFFFEVIVGNMVGNLI